MEKRIAFIGFGEAAMAFAEQWGDEGGGPAGIAAFDIKTDTADAEAKRADYRRHRVDGADDLAGALDGADLIMSLVTADQAVAAARAAAAALLAPGALYCDFNSIAPHSKRAAADAIGQAGGRYVDVAVMAPVRPARLAVPLLASGPHADEAARALAALGFSPRAIGGAVGDAATVKMLRSVMVKGMEALSAECFVAAEAAGVAGEVARSLADGRPGADWRERADYNLERMMVHGTRRAAEMDEVAATLEALGADPVMARATAAAQRRIGELGLDPAPGLAAKAALLAGQRGVGKAGAGHLGEAA